jgi:hypothetical protein
LKQNFQAPGPGAYQTVIEKPNQRNEKGLLGGKSGLIRDNSGIRQFAHLPKQDQGSIKTLAPSQFEGAGLTNQISVTSLKNKKIINAVESQNIPALKAI